MVKLVRELYEQTEFDVLALGEVCTADLSAIVAGMGAPHLSVHDATDRESKPMFDTAVIYDERRLCFEGNRSIQDRFARQTLKTGEVVALRSTLTNQPFQLVVSHWPSRITAQELDSVRMELGTSLRRSLQGMSEDGASPYTILMGDYNDDPFSRSLAHHLLATRDRGLARRRGEYFYNPFWKQIGESHDDLHEDDNGICGTHFYSRGRDSRWFTYDQMMFSSAFLSNQGMVLRERETGILAPPELRSKLLATREIFDHLPVLGTVELRVQK
ncbi:endonuclease/exonuclease/phosphatase family protein [Ralstonia sp. CHL-2022]|uniref:Endonuclease/exonuclease/phosphatase family protein n=1 Tax=Ralstonia mojiangensis TaxID=2953895 RepID=A0ABT2LE10_9RALS|nr:endonuclease/exonuclease/phosphatase family protein [Ralstonia mojiangensis]MCT7313279.1 endonuclease/exonuclease/phosphatase family protein [Ralstonia mojiangensis]